MSDPCRTEGSTSKLGTVCNGSVNGNSEPLPEKEAITVTESGSEHGGITGRLKLALNVGAWIIVTLKYVRLTITSTIINVKIYTKSFFSKNSKYKSFKRFFSK